VAKVALSLTAGLLAASFALLNFNWALRQHPEPPHVERFFSLEGQSVPVPNLARLMGRLAFPAALALGAFTGMLAWGAWEIFLRYRYQVPFGETDPLFGRDIAFYFFTLPTLEFLAGLLLTLVLVCLLGAAAIYATREADFFSKLRRFELGQGPRAHLLSLVAALFLLLAWQAYLEMPNLLFSNSGPMAGATYTDVNATLPCSMCKSAWLCLSPSWLRRVCSAMAWVCSGRA
jgi:uncharacterized membrane protein (UPF0182 family)